MKILLLYILIGLIVDFIFISVLNILSLKFNIDVWDWFYRTFDTGEGTIPLFIILIPILYLPIAILLLVFFIFVLIYKFSEFCTSDKAITFFKKIVKEKKEFK